MLITSTDTEAIRESVVHWNDISVDVKAATAEEESKQPESA